MVNAKQKEYNASYRRRGKAKGHIKKLSQLIKESNQKDTGLLLKKIEDLREEAANKFGIYDNMTCYINGIGESIEAGDEIDEEKRTLNRKFGAFAVGRYYCSTCKNLGYLFSPNLDSEDQNLELYMLHLNFPLEKSTFCKISSVPRHRVMIAALPTSGVLTITKPKVYHKPIDTGTKT